MKAPAIAPSRQGGDPISIAVVVAIVLMFLSPSAHAQPAEKTRNLDPVRLDRAIDTVIRQPEFAWRARTPAGPPPEGRWVSWLRSGVDMLVRAQQWVMGKLRDWFGSQSDEDKQKGRGAQRPPLELWISLAGLLLAGAAVALLLRFRRTPAVEAEAADARTAAPDVRDESIQADQIPESSWLALAEEWLAKGDCRLATRALYLAGLNHLSGRKLIALGRSKTGLDYRRELERRARQNTAVDPQVGSTFLQSVAMFEKGWYGRHPVDRPDVEALAKGLEEVRRFAGRR